MVSFHQLQGLCCSQTLHITELSDLLTPAELIPLCILRCQCLHAKFFLLLAAFLMFFLKSAWWEDCQSHIIKQSSSTSMMSSQASLSFRTVSFFCFFLQLCDSTCILWKCVFCWFLKVTASATAAFFMVAVILGFWDFLLKGEK